MSCSTPPTRFHVRFQALERWSSAFKDWRATARPRRGIPAGACVKGEDLVPQASTFSPDGLTWEVLSRGGMRNKKKPAHATPLAHDHIRPRTSLRWTTYIRGPYRRWLVDPSNHGHMHAPPGHSRTTLPLLRTTEIGSLRHGSLDRVPTHHAGQTPSPLTLPLMASSGQCAMTAGLENLEMRQKGSRSCL